MGKNKITNSKASNKLKEQIFKNRASFSNYNVVRMREALRYLSKKKVNIFTQIPFLIHSNSKELPGFVDSDEKAHGIWNFENSGFYKAMVTTGQIKTNEENQFKVDNPAVLGFYHIGSLGTFTQSIGSDFDYWLIIDKKKFSEERYYNLEKKLAQILKYSREKYDQEVTFFIMDREDIKNNTYASFKGEETLLAPKIFLKEEFYRTFLMIAGKIPYWAVLPAGISTQSYYAQINKVLSHDALKSIVDDFIDLGNIETIEWTDILKGLSWHICKSRLDPVKALIKATMLLSYGFDNLGSKALLCDEIKSGYANAGIDDYSVDPYKIVFDRLIRFHEENDISGLNLIKNAIFFRLCGYPSVAIPEKGSPKRQLIDWYIRNWNLNNNQVSKLLSYTSWPESEKLLLEVILLKRLTSMNDLAMAQKGARQHFNTGRKKEERNWNILQNKTMERLRKSPKKIPESSTFLKRKKTDGLLIKNINMVTWSLYSISSTEKKNQRINFNKYLLGILGWIAQNQLYDRTAIAIKIDYSLPIFESTSEPVDPDRIYLSLQPLKPLSDDIFENTPVWKKVVILLIFENSHEINILKKAEILITNSWGELYLDNVELDKIDNMKDKCFQIVMKIKEYTSAKLRMFIFQLSVAHDPDIVYQLKLSYEEQIKTMDSKQENYKRSTPQKPYLDIL
ncbi:MAG: adenylate cyclase [Desulfobacula sp.]|nr:adenylate cyclase [Desulfobacula sp.]